jgi:hypothetical protein
MIPLFYENEAYFSNNHDDDSKIFSFSLIFLCFSPVLILPYEFCRICSYGVVIKSEVSSNLLFISFSNSSISILFLEKFQRRPLFACCVFSILSGRHNSVKFLTPFHC